MKVEADDKVVLKEYQCSGEDRQQEDRKIVIRNFTVCTAENIF
jgi:hypothetical protein